MIPKITDRRRDVLQLLCCGYSNQEIAARLHVTQSTVKTHLRDLMNQFGAGDRTHLAILTLKQGVTSLEAVVPKEECDR